MDATKQFWGFKTDGGLYIWNILQVAATVILVAIVWDCIVFGSLMQIQRIENNREQIKDRLSMVSLEKMNEEFECLMRI